MFGLCIHSEVPFPGYPQGGEAADAVIQFRTLGVRDVLTGERRGSRVAERLYHEPLNSDVLFEVVGGKRITLHPLQPIDDEILRGWITGIFLPVLLRQRGVLVLHASAVARGEEAVAFIGNSGQGKSTMAEFCRSHGYTVLTDDVLAVQIEQGAARVFPSYPAIRLRPGLERMVSDFDALPVLSWKDGRRVRKVDLPIKGGHSLKKVYVLEGAVDEVESIVDLAPTAALFHLLAQSRSKDLLSDPLFQTALVQQLGDLVRTVPVAHLRRVLSLDRLPDLLALVEQDVWGEATPVTKTCT